MTSRTYEAPGPETWEQDSTHCPRPLTPYLFDLFKKSFVRGFKEGSARYGLLFSHLEPALVNGFMYYRDSVVDPDDSEEVGRRFESARHGLESKIWREDLDLWDREIKPDSIRRNNFPTEHRARRAGCGWPAGASGSRLRQRARNGLPAP